MRFLMIQMSLNRWNLVIPMIKADVPQDVTEYKEQFFFGMNSRQLICSVLMIVIAVLVFLVGSKFISTDILVYITIALIAPLAAVGFLKYNGMGFEKIAATVAEFYVSNQRRRMEYLPDEIEIHDTVRKIYIQQLEEERKAEKKNMKRRGETFERK